MHGNSERIKEFLKDVREETGFGGHMYNAVMLGDEKLRRELSGVFGEEHTSVASDFDSLVEEVMIQFAEEMEDYFRNRTV